ncbi:hypothetical protein WDU94_013563 [Cyamophila willieti]
MQRREAEKAKRQGGRYSWKKGTEEEDKVSRQGRRKRSIFAGRVLKAGISCWRGINRGRQKENGVPLGRKDFEERGCRFHGGKSCVVRRFVHNIAAAGGRFGKIQYDPLYGTLASNAGKWWNDALRSRIKFKWRPFGNYRGEGVEKVGRELNPYSKNFPKYVERLSTNGTFDGACYRRGVPNFPIELPFSHRREKGEFVEETDRREVLRRQIQGLSITFDLKLKSEYFFKRRKRKKNGGGKKKEHNSGREPDESEERRRERKKSKVEEKLIKRGERGGRMEETEKKSKVEEKLMKARRKRRKNGGDREKEQSGRETDESEEKEEEEWRRQRKKSKVEEKLMKRGERGGRMEETEKKEQSGRETDRKRGERGGRMEETEKKEQSGRETDRSEEKEEEEWRRQRKKSKVEEKLIEARRKRRKNGGDREKRAKWKRN